MLYGVENLRFGYEEKPIFEDLSFQVAEAQIFCILGPSGCGKTTLLKLLSGLLRPWSGHVDDFFNGQKSFLFQEPRLVPTLTVAENLRFTTKGKMKEEDMKKAVQEALLQVDMTDFKDYYPDELSGGMAQRAAIARAFLYPSRLLFLDEPFKSLDIETKLSTIQAFESARQKNKKTVIMVTHDALVAALLGDQMMILSARPTEKRALFENPLPKEERSLHNPQTAGLEAKLYGYMLDEMPLADETKPIEKVK